MGELDVGGVLAWTLVLFFLGGGIANGIAPEAIRRNYARWGYPAWFHYVTAAVELVVAALLVFPDTRLAGAALAAAVMAAAAGTLLIHREYPQSIAPIGILTLASALGWITWA